MRKTMMISLLFAAGCLGGKSDSQTTALNGVANDQEDQPEDPGDPNQPVPADPGVPPDDAQCIALREQLGICWQDAAPACEAANNALSQCHEAINLQCQPVWEAYELCLQAGVSDCQAETDAALACKELYSTCFPLEQATYDCAAACYQLEQAFQENCIRPPQPELPPYCPPLFDALALCQQEAATLCGWGWSEDRPDGNGMGTVPPEGGEDCFARCYSIEIAIGELCPVEQPPCDEHPDRPYPDDPNGGGSDPGDPNGGMGGEPTDPDGSSGR